MEKHDWVISTTGKVLRRDKAKPTDVIHEVLEYFIDDNTNDKGIVNSFPTKEDAYVCRDSIIDYNPVAFLEQHQPCQTKDEQNMSKKDYTQEEFSKLTRKKLIENYDVFWTNFRKLRPKDACDVYMKMARYGFAVAPQLKPLDAEAEQRLAAYKREQTAETIASGLPNDEYELDEDG